MTVGLAQRSAYYASLDDFISSWAGAFQYIYEMSGPTDVMVGTVPAKQFIVKKKDGTVVMIATIFWENETAHIISSGGRADTLTDEEWNFLDTYVNTR
jgi:hypothetical protein